MPDLTRKQLKHASKFLSLVLRHRPQAVGIELDDAGWVGVDTLLTAFHEKKPWYTREVLDEVVATNNKKRFEFDDTGTRIRARQGHSVDVDLGYKPVDPPDVLYHGTALKYIDSIRNQGLRKMKRHHVHLSADHDTASNVGSRHGTVMVLTIDAKQMHADGHQFYVSNNGVWLVDSVPVKYILQDLG